MLDNIRLALASLWANKMRALLTMLGIIIGIGSVIAIVTVGDSLTGSFTDEMSGVGARNITVSLQSKNFFFPNADAADSTGEEPTDFSFMNYAYTEPTAADLLTDEMIAAYRKAFAGQLSALVTTEELGSGTLTNGRNSAKFSLSGTNPDYAQLNKLPLLAGRFLAQSDLAAKGKRAVVSDVFVRDWLGKNTQPQDAIGKRFVLDVDGRTLALYVTGVYQYKQPDGQNKFRKDSKISTEIYIPVTTGKQFKGLPAGYQSLTVLAKNEVSNADFLKQTNRFFAAYYLRNTKITSTASSMEAMMKSFTKMLGSLKLGISAVAAISLLVGGIGVMNIMLVSITERTREIGVRKALGAPGLVIRMQFIVEAVVICCIGGIIGILLGVGLGSLGAHLLKYAARPSLTAVLGAVSFSMAIGVFFGYYPSSKAAKMDPIDALRYE